MSTVIKVENLAKSYLISHRHKRIERYIALRDVITDKFKGLFSWRKQKPNFNREEFWALKDINLEIKKNERLGIIGRNGAGKSTLLKILSRITEPTRGRVSIKGRVASLLEVGTGFHPELTGRENIFLNGAILGMKKKEIQNKFDKIVSFAEIEQFVDTPVKRYSSGMYVRLAFAVAAHLEPEILVVDEVLAVGDFAFQKKCLGKMKDVAEEGRTVLFVSHNMEAIKRLCRRTILLNYGEIIEDGATESTISRYISEGIHDKASFKDYIKKLYLDSVFKLYDIDITQDGAEDSGSLQFVNSKDIIITFNYEVLEDAPNLSISFELWDTAGTYLAETFHNDGINDKVVKKGVYVSEAVIPANTLVPISYELKIWFCIWDSYTFTKDPMVIIFDVYSDGTANLARGKRHVAGKVILPIKWDTRRV